MCRLIEPPPRHVIKLPKLSQEEMKILRQKPASQTDVFVQGLALSLLNEEDGFYKALGVLLGSCKDISHELASEMLKKRIALLRKGNIRAWRKLCELAEKRSGSPVSKIIMKLSPLKRRNTP